MINVSEAFKTAIKAESRQQHAYLDDGVTQIDDTNDLQSFKIITNGDIGKAVMRQAEVVYIGNHEYLGQYVHLGLGIVLPDTTTEWIDYGSFRIVSKEENKGNDGIKIKMFDKMYDAEVKYDLTPTFPMTLKQFLQAICVRFNWVLATDSFVNDSLVISSDLFSNLGVSFREILDDIAEATASIIYFDVDDTLVLKQVGEVSVETLDSDVLNTLKLEESYGPITAIVLSRMPQEDNIVQNAPS